MDTRKKNSNEFETIYLKAEGLNKRGLETEIAAHASVNITDNRGLFTPVAQLAFEGKIDAVTMLLGFNASPSQAAMGFASAGNQVAAEDIRKNHGINLELLATGAAMSSDIAYAEWLRTHYFLNPAWFVFGAALVGNAQYAEKLLNSLIPTNTDLLRKQQETAQCMYVRGLVMGGHYDAATAFLDKHKDQQSALFLKEAIEAAARTGDLFNIGETEAAADGGPVPFLYRHGRQPHVLKEYRYRAAVGAAKGGHIHLARKLFMQTDQLAEQRDNIILAAMVHGHITETLQHFPCPQGLALVNDAFLSHPLTLRAAIFGGHESIYSSITHKKIDTVLVAEVAQRGDLNTARDLAMLSRPDLESVVKRLDSDKYFQSEEVLLYALTFSNSGGTGFTADLADTAWRIKSDEDAKRALNPRIGDNVFIRQFLYDFKEINRRATKIRSAMQRLDINYDQAKAYLEHKVVLDVETVSRLLSDAYDPADSPVLVALSGDFSTKLRDQKKEESFSRLQHVITTAYAKNHLPEITLDKLPDLRQCKVEVNLYNLVAKMAFNGFSVEKVASELSCLTGLTPEDASDLYEKFCLRVLKQFVDSKLDRYISYNNQSSIYQAPLSRMWELTRRPYDMMKHAHTGRAQSVREEVVKLDSRASVLGIFKFTKGLFEKTVSPSKSADEPKWKQPLDNSSRDDEFYQIAKDVTNSRMTNN